ncbi:hypothetical protein O6H91_03G035900 [Diphasiastrum complanatum]|uniref:Uncharacterized protein n=16 Tax=Diphasiastrum complanatum TaxID=34168 RepID=A0ACC2E559_DIPCM|nr:hypothetical protein O6H91_03G035900 [Diphasiastrum complanatum]KAJ7561620.1 hypothetical protein O6H91_03G035900 [Diphasiastrum complanatum]KAJ7561621.1 hypothetical protein O6H91_03G035900 [Diphasiastrum complanatum]KAJ7561622.1 hypothetical protein O6H91_03G035900 [Diphasiastrum complanatum]KAJ7561623.1 hypothetical protein O6H91_03G035900 [Diphasiastrum complanatum]
MSFVFRGSRGDLESGPHNLIPERRTVRIHGGSRALNANPMAFLVTVLLLFMIVNSHQMSPNFLLWLGMGVFLMATSLRMYAMCQQLQAQAQATAAATAGTFLGHTELRLRMPPSIAFAARGRLQGLRLQLALLDREFDDLDYDALRALDGDNPPGVASMSEAEISTLPVHKYKAPSCQNVSNTHQSESMVQQQTASTTANDLLSKRTDFGSSESPTKKLEEEFTCSVCLEHVMEGELLRSLPCLHQFHAICIDQWLRQQATCPVCKFRLTPAWQDGSNSGSAISMIQIG